MKETHVACNQAHPDRPELTCDKTPHPFGAHMHRETGTIWAGSEPPKPVSSPKGAALRDVAEKIEASGARRRTGPVDTLALRNDILDKTWEATESESKELLREAILACARTGEPFTANDVIDRMPEGWKPGHVNSVGAAFGSASRAGLIAKAGFAASQGEKANGRVVHLWVGA